MEAKFKLRSEVISEFVKKYHCLNDDEAFGASLAMEFLAEYAVAAGYEEINDVVNEVMTTLDPAWEEKYEWPKPLTT